MVDGHTDRDAHRHGQRPTPQPVFAGHYPMAPEGAEDRTEVLLPSAHARVNRPSYPTPPTTQMPWGPTSYSSHPAQYGSRPARYPFVAVAPAKQGRISLRLYSIGAAAVVGAVALAAIALGAGGEESGGSTDASQPTTGSVGTPAAPPAVGAADLEGLLRDEVAVGAELQMTLERRDLPGATTLYNDTVDQAACIGAVVPASRAAYEDSGWVSVRKSVLGSPDLSQTIYQAVVSFPTAERASAFVAAQAQAWQSCDGQTVILDPGDEPLPIDIATVATDGTTLTAVAFPGGASEKGCDRALRATANVVVDVQNCGPQPSQDATRVAAMISEQVSTL